MSEPILACVRTGTSYGFEYVTKLRNMIWRHMRQPYSIVCLTDQPERCEGVTFIDVSEVGLPGWWTKMLLFSPDWRGTGKVIFLDLDTVIIDDLTPLAGVPGEFAILKTPVLLATYPCKYNSSVMVIGGGLMGYLWTNFDKRRDELMKAHARYGDQAAIEELYPDAALLQNLLPDFFCNYRHLTMHPPKAAVVNFGGAHKPANCPIPWVEEAWR